MTDKDLVLTDLSSRLPYGVIVEEYGGPVVLTGGLYDIITRQAEDRMYKPYLRPMSSMTEEEVDEFTQFDVYANGEYVMPNYEAIDWLNSHYFDYRGLIPKDKAIDITAGYNPYERKWLNASDLQTYISVEGRNLIHIIEIINNARNFVSALWRAIEHGPNVIDVQVPSNFNTVVIDIQVRHGFISIEIGKSKVGFFTDFDDGINKESDGIETDFRSIPEQILKLLKEE